MVGMKRFPNEDMVSLDIGKINFANKPRDKKPVQGRNIILFKWKRRQCAASKVAEVFDLTGKITPLQQQSN